MDIEYEIKYKDIDPDTGYVTQDETIALASNISTAELIKCCLEENWANNDGDPNREFYIKKAQHDG